MSTVRTLLEEQLPSAGPDVAGWFGVTRDQNMEGKTRVNNVKMVAGNKERGKRNDEGKKGNGRIGGIGKA